MAIRAILFDNDGTLVDTHDLILSSMRHTVNDVFGLSLPDEQLMAKVGIPLADQMMDFAGSIEQRDEFLRVYREHNHAHHDAAVKAFPGVIEGLQELSEAGFALGVVTSKRAPLAMRGLQITGAWPYMSCLVGADECPKAKPDPDPILMGADLLAAPIEECVYLGDSPFDIHAGKASGCVAVAALWGMFTLEQLEGERPDYTCDSFAEFVELMKRLAFE